MRGGSPATDLRNLEAAFARLSIRLEAAEERIAALEEGQGWEPSSRAPSTSGYSVVTSAPPRQSTATSSIARPPAQEYPLPASAPQQAPQASRLSEREREELADQIGDWLRRELDGRGGGVSGRDRLELRSRLYVLAADHRGTRFNPVRVYSRLADLRTHFLDRQNPGQAIFIGFASSWEARRAVAKAGLSWPDAGY